MGINIIVPRLKVALWEIELIPFHNIFLNQKIEVLTAEYFKGPPVKGGLVSRRTGLIISLLS
jgi:hypothetical protein